MKTDAIENLISKHLEQTEDSPVAREAEAELAALEAKLREWEEREAGCCPEDRGFEEVIAWQSKRIATLEADNAAMRADDYRLRAMLAFRCAGPSLYGDDGELQDCSVLPHIDFKNDSPSEISRKLIKRANDKLIAERALTPDSGKVLVDLDRLQKIHYWISCAHWAGPPSLERDSLIKAVGGMLLLKDRP